MIQDRNVAEVVFHTLQDKGYKVFYKPGKEEFHKYIDISTPAIIVKPMVSDSPLMTIDGVPGPSLEKLLVDKHDQTAPICRTARGEDGNRK